MTNSYRFVFNTLGLLLDPLLKKHRGKRVLIWLALYEQCQGFFELSQVLKHHLLEAEMTSVQIDRDEAGIQT